MQHVKQIRQSLIDGDVESAKSALDNLLLLGPKNTAALKLQATLMEHEGRFDAESKLWHLVAEIDQDDPDLSVYIRRRHTEDREKMYFSDELPAGGRRFFAYPKSLLAFSGIGMLGCLGFLLLVRPLQQLESERQILFLILGFFTLVIAPWLGILYTYLFGLRAIAVSRKGILIQTRVRNHELAWTDVEDVCLAFNHSYDKPILKLLLVPKDAYAPVLAIDYQFGASTIRARQHLVHEIRRFFRAPSHRLIQTLTITDRKILRF